VRQLHVLGVSDDGEALLLGPSAGKASHRLRLDDKLRAAVRGQLSAVGVERAESALSPKEMQSRLREGASPEEVAKEAQVPVARVLPYAAPVIAERERIVEQARAAVLHRSRGPNGQRPLGEVVDVHLNDAAGLKPESVEWTARRRRDGAGEVHLAYAARGGRRAAPWLWRPLERDLTALDASATRLAAEEGGTTRRKPAAAKRPTATRPATKRSAGTRATKKSARRPAAAKKATKTVKAAKAARTSARPAAKPAARPAASKPAARKAAAKPARTARTATPTPKRSSVTRSRTAARRAPAVVKATKAPAKTVKKAAKAAKPAAVKPAKPARKRVSKPEPDVTLVRPTVVPDPVVTEPPTPIVVIRPQVDPEPEPQPEPEPIVARRRGERVPLPSWSDVLLGVAPPEGSREANARRRRKSG
jgi:hypothetical protein